MSHICCAPATFARSRPFSTTPRRSANDRYVATELLRNANIAAGGVLPMCQDTGTAIVHAHRGRHVLTDGRDAEHLSLGISRAYTTLNLRYSQLAPLSMFDERNTRTNLPAQIEIYADGDDTYRIPLHRQGLRQRQQELPVPADTRNAESRRAARLHRHQGRRDRHLGMPALPPRGRDRRHQRRIRA